MKVAFFGTPQFAAVSLERLLAGRHQVVCVVTQPDTPSGRGRKVSPPPVKTLAAQNGIAVLQPKSVKAPEFAGELRGHTPDIGVVVAYGKILPPEVLEAPRLGFLNIHGSLLPKYRGAAPIQWAVANGEKTTGVTIQQVVEELDAGPIVSQQKVDILEDDDAKSLYDMLSVVGADLLCRTLDDIEDRGSIESTEQDPSQATYAPLIKREDARIDWTRSAEEIICAVRGFVLWPGAHTTFKGGEDLKVTGAEAVDASWMTVNWRDATIPVGTVVDTIKNRGFVVKTGGDGLVLVTRAQVPGKRETDAWSLVNGGYVDVGLQFELS